jgi:D-glycero-alpha-D-manno-heptose-7-phosphate kinase
LLLFYTGMQRYSDTIQKKHVGRIADNSRLLQKMAQMASSGRDLLHRGAGSLEEFGALLGEAWELKKSLKTGVSNRKIDEMYGAALSAGAKGGKLLGAGGGGFLLLYVPPSRQSEVREALSPLLEVNFRFENVGSQIIFYDPEKLAGPGAA